MSRWEDNSRLEAELTERLARRPAPADFSANVMAAVRRGEFVRPPVENVRPPVEKKFLPRPRLNAWAAAALAAASLVVGFGIHRRLGANEAARLAEAREAEAHLVESLYLAGITFNLARDAAFGEEGVEGK